MRAFRFPLLLVFLVPLTAHAQRETKLVAFDGNEFDGMGTSVAIGGNTVFAGAPGKDVFPFVDRGTVYIFSRNPLTKTWSHVQHFDGRDPNAAFGASVALEGEWAAVGSPGEDVLDSASQGAVHVFRQDPGGLFHWAGWLVSQDGRAGDRFGSAVALSGECILVGAPFDDDPGLASGSAYVFRRSGSSWLQEAKLVREGGPGNARFGSAVSLSGDYALIGVSMMIAQADDTTSAAYVFKREATGWRQQAKLVAPDAIRGDYFGEAVSIDDPWAIVGASGDDDRGEFSGSAYLYEREGDVWTFRTKLTANNGTPDSWFGASVALRDTCALIGTLSSPTVPGGSTYLFTRGGQVWHQQAEVSPEQSDTLDLFGTSVAISDDDIIVGATHANRSAAIPMTGAAYVFSGIRSGKLSVSPPRIDFGDVLSGDIATQPLTVLNAGLVDLAVSSVTIGGTGAPAFTVDGSPFVLAPGASQPLQVRFSPTAAASYAASLTITSTGGNESVQLRGRGSSPLSASPDTLDFGSVIVGRPDPVRQVTVRNLGATALTMDSAALRPLTGGAGGFLVQPVGPILLNPGMSADIQVSFSPQHQMGYTARLSIFGGLEKDSVLLKGNGLQVGTTAVYPDTLHFGDVLLGLWAKETLYVSNTGVHALSVGPITFSGEGTGTFSCNPTTFSLLTGEVQPVLVDFRPLAGRSYNGLLHTNANAGDDTVHLIGRGIPAGIIDVTPDTLHFGEWPLGTGTSMTLYVRNGGLVDLHVGSIALSGSQASVFAVDQTPFTLGPTAVRRLRIGFTPLVTGMSNAEVTIVSDGGTIVVPLDGIGKGCTPPFRTVVFPASPVQTYGFGRSAALSGATFIIGSDRDPMSDASGSVFVFGCEADAWTQRAQLNAPPTQGFDDFGHAVGLSGYHAIVGDPIRSEEGAAFIFTYQGGIFGGWKLTDSLAPAMAYPRLGNFGHAVALDGDVAVVGAPNTIVGLQRDMGAAYIFRGVGSPGVGGWHLLDSLVAPPTTTKLRFGYSVDISGNFAIAGTMAWGAAVFQGGTMTAGTPWIQTDWLLSSDYQEGDYFGNPVAIDGDYALVAATLKPITSNHGAVYVFKRSGVHWKEVAILRAPTPSAGEEFGSSLALSNDLAMIAGRERSIVYLFKRMSDTVWAHAGTLDFFPGTSRCVALDANAKIGVVGAGGISSPGTPPGAAVVFTGLPPTDVEDGHPLLPALPQLHQNYPNPFNARTTITYDLPRAGDVRLIVFDILGREVAVLLNGRYPAGRHRVTFDARRLASGVYLSRLASGGFTQTRRMMLLR